MPGSDKALTERKPKALKSSNKIAMCFSTQSKLTRHGAARHGTARHGTLTLSGKNIRWGNRLCKESGKNNFRWFIFKAVYKISPILSAQHSLQTEDAPVSQKANGDIHLSCKSGLHTNRRAAHRHRKYCQVRAGQCRLFNHAAEHVDSCYMHVVYGQSKLRTFLKLPIIHCGDEDITYRYCLRYLSVT